MEHGGAILELPVGSEQDYIMKEKYKGIPISKLPEIKSLSMTLNQLEFKEFGNMLCTLYAGMIMYINNAKITIFEEARKALCRKRVKANFSLTEGGYLVDGVKCVIEGLNDGIMYRLNKSEVKKLLDKGYVVNIGIFIGENLKEFSKDSVITEEEIKLIKDKKWGHSTCLRKNKRLNSYEGVKENNIVKIDDIEGFLNSWFVYDWAYLIVPNVVIRSIFKKVLRGVSYEESTTLYRKIENDLYSREKSLFQEVIQMKYLGKTI